MDLSHVKEKSLGAKVFEMLREHPCLWDGMLGTIPVMKHFIPLKKGIKPIRKRVGLTEFHALPASARDGCNDCELE